MPIPLDECTHMFGKEPTEREDDHPTHAVSDQHCGLSGSYSDHCFQVATVPFEAVITLSGFPRMTETLHAPHDHLVVLAQGADRVVPGCPVGARAMGEHNGRGVAWPIPLDVQGRGIR